MPILLYRVQCPAAEAEGLDPGYYSQHQCGEATEPGRSYRRWRLGLEEAASLLHGNRQMLPHTYGGCTIQLHVWIPGVLACRYKLDTLLFCNWPLDHTLVFLGLQLTFIRDCFLIIRNMKSKNNSIYNFSKGRKATTIFNSLVRQLICIIRKCVFIIDKRLKLLINCPNWIDSFFVDWLLIGLLFIIYISATCDAFYIIKYSACNSYFLTTIHQQIHIRSAHACTLNFAKQNVNMVHTYHSHLSYHTSVTQCSIRHAYIFVHALLNSIHNNYVIDSCISGPQCGL